MEGNDWLRDYLKKNLLNKESGKKNRSLQEGV